MDVVRDVGFNQLHFLSRVQLVPILLLTEYTTDVLQLAINLELWIHDVVMNF